jgi:GTP-binding protein
MQARLPIVAIVGRPNVGKSTLFNRLVKKRKAIVGDRPGVTVDRLESHCDLGSRQVVLVDTGGIGEPQHGEMQASIDAQVEAALDVADLVIFAVDGQNGCTPVDEAIADKLRRHQLPVAVVVNKAENPDVVHDFHVLGLGEPYPVSAIHGQGVRHFVDALQALVPELPPVTESAEEPLAGIAVIGRPNVGKSTLINAWLGRDRMVVSPIAGTTRDAIDSDLPYGDGVVRLVDTAGQRKHGRISDIIEFVARVKAVQAFRRADCAVMVLDGSEGIVEQDMRLMRLAHEEGCALIVAVNKVDLLSDEEWAYYVERLDFRMRGLPDVPVFRIAAKERKGVRKLLDEAVKAAGRNGFTLGTGELNRWLEKAQERQRPPGDRGVAVRMKYASQISSSPPTLKIFCNRPKLVKDSYLRYLEQDFRKTFRLPGVPVRIRFSSSDNPYADKGKRR